MDRKTLKEGEQAFSGAVLTDHAGHIHVRAQRGHIQRHVPGPARHLGFAGDLHHRHGGFRGNPADRPPEEMIQHQVADDQRFDMRKSLDEGLPLRWIHRWMLWVIFRRY